MSTFAEEKQMASKTDDADENDTTAAGGIDGTVDVDQAKKYMKEKVDPIMSELLTKLVVEQPDDVLSYVVAFCNAKRELDPEVQRKRQEVARQFGQQAERPVTPPGKYKSKTYGGRHVSYSGTAGGTTSTTAASMSGASESSPRAPITAAERREAMLAAAEKRSQTRTGGRGVTISEEKRKELAVKRKRDEMVGRIRAMYSAAGVDEPFGLGMAKMEVLEMHYARAKGFAKGGARAQQKADRLSGIQNGLKL